MSRRKNPIDVDTQFQRVRLVCPLDGEHHLGDVYRQMGRDMLQKGIERIDGPNGETKLEVRCPVCAKAARAAGPYQVRWERIRDILEQMQVVGDHYRDFVVGR